MKIAIYNGNLIPTTFVLRLAQVVSEEHIVFVSGTSSKLFKYKSKNVFYLPTDSNQKFVLLIQFVFKFLTFSVVHPKKCKHFISILRKSNKPIQTKLKQFLIWSKFISHKIDVVHIQWASHIYLFEELLDDSYLKIMLSLRGRLINITPLANADLKTLYHETFPKVDQFHAVTHDIKKQAMIYGAIEEKIKVIYSGVEVESFESFKKTDYSKADTLKILSVGRQHWKKGYNYALEAIKLLREKNIKTSYTIVGAAGAEEIVITVNDLQIDDCVTLTSKMQFKAVLKEMQNADVLVLPSVSEGPANVVIEAMAIGLPVISTDAVGMSELVIHNDTGLLFSNRNVNDLAKKIMDFISMPQNEIENMSNRAKQKIKEQHNWKTFKQSFNEFYKC